MVGEIDVAIADQKATIEFLSDHVLFRFSDFRTARSIMSNPMPNLRQIGKLLSFGQIDLKAQIGSRKVIELYPRPNWVVKWFSPAIRSMLGA